MKLVRVMFVVILSVFYSKVSYCQDKVYKERAIAINLLDEQSREAIKNENVDLQTFVETLYISSSKLYNQALPAVKKGDYVVLIENMDGSPEKKPISSKLLKGISLDKIEEITYKKSEMYSVIYGKHVRLFGIVILKLKK